MFGKMSVLLNAKRLPSQCFATGLLCRVQGYTWFSVLRLGLFVAGIVCMLAPAHAASHGVGFRVPMLVLSLVLGDSTTKALTLKH